MDKTKSEDNAKFKITDLPGLLKETYKTWNAENPFRLSAVVAYYAILALPGLLVILINTVGAIWGQEIVSGKLAEEIANVLGTDAAKTIQDIIVSTQVGDKSLISTIIGIATLIFGATGVFYHLQLSLNEIWGIRQDPDSGIKKLLRDRAVSFAFVLVIGFLLLISLLISAGIALLSGYIQSIFPHFSIWTAYLLNAGLSLAIISILFALLFKYLPDAKIKWKTVWKGAVITALLFVVGKFLLGLYFGQANPGSMYGAAGTIILILLWVSYSCLILFFGAEFTRIYAKHYGQTIVPKGHAMLVEKSQKTILRGSQGATANEEEKKTRNTSN